MPNPIENICNGNKVSISAEAGSGKKDDNKRYKIIIHRFQDLSEQAGSICLKVRVAIFRTGDDPAAKKGTILFQVLWPCNDRYH